MADILSQNEIDALLNELNTGEVDVKEIDNQDASKQVKVYDFSRPEKFSKEQLRSLEAIHDNIGRLISNSLNANLRCYVDMSVLSTESMVFEEFTNSVVWPSIVSIINFSPLNGKIMMAFSNELAFAIIEKLLGGTGEGDSDVNERELTEIDYMLLKSTIVKMVHSIKEPWTNVIELDPTLDAIETNAQSAQIASPKDAIVLVTYRVMIGEIESMISVAIPHYVIEPILPNLSAKVWFGDNAMREKSASEVEGLISQLQEAAVSIKAVVGKSIISVGELLELAQGDILVLDKQRDQAFDVLVKDGLKFRGTPGVLSNRMAVKITEVIDGNERVK